MKLYQGTNAKALAIAVIAFSVGAAAQLPASAAQFKTKVQIKHYVIKGETGRKLYVSIGKNGPQIGRGTQTIAHTTFDLKWRRNYKRRGSSCVLVSAKPFFTVIYTLPKPSNKLGKTVAIHWKCFYDGILTHEKVHGIYARELVQQIIKSTVGLKVKNDPKCRKTKAEVFKRVKVAYKDYSSKSGAFDRVEMSAGGNVRSLVARLLKGR